MSFVLQILSPQAEELQAKRRELTELRRKLADKQLELSTEHAQLHIFERRYQGVVGQMYAELDQVKAQVLGLATKVFPQADNFREEAESAREQAREFKEEIPEAKKPKEFNPPENLKKLFRRVAKRIHPDLASSATERERRHDLMAKLNQAQMDWMMRLSAPFWWNGRQKSLLTKNCWVGFSKALRISKKYF